MLVSAFGSIHQRVHYTLHRHTMSVDNIHTRKPEHTTHTSVYKSKSVLCNIFPIFERNGWVYVYQDRDAVFLIKKFGL